MSVIPTNVLKYLYHVPLTSNMYKGIDLYNTTSQDMIKHLHIRTQFEGEKKLMWELDLSPRTKVSKASRPLGLFTSGLRCSLLV